MKILTILLRDPILKRAKNQKIACINWSRLKMISRACRECSDGSLSHPGLFEGYSTHIFRIHNLGFQKHPISRRSMDILSENELIKWSRSRVITRAPRWLLDSPLSHFRPSRRVSVVFKQICTSKNELSVISLKDTIVKKRKPPKSVVSTDPGAELSIKLLESVQRALCVATDKSEGISVFWGI